MKEKYESQFVKSLGEKRNAEFFSLWNDFFKGMGQ